MSQNPINSIAKDFETKIGIIVGILKDVQSFMRLVDGDHEESILNKMRTARQYAYSLTEFYILKLTLRLYQENLLVVLTDLIYEPNNYDEDIVDVSIDLLSKLFEIHPDDIMTFYSNSILDALKSQIFSRNPRLVGSVT